MAKVLVTGPTGAAGQYVLELLMTTDHNVRVLALPDSMHRINFRDRIETVPGQLSDRRALREAVEGVEVVFHTALVSPPPALKPEMLASVNVEGTRNLLEACSGHVRRFVMVSSNNVYMPHRSPAMWPLLDDAPRMAHGNPQQIALGESLIAAEDAVFDAAGRGETDFTILRPTVIAGRSAAFIDSMIIDIIRGTADLDLQRRTWDMMQWTHGADLGRAALLVANEEEARNQCYLVAGSEPVTVYDVRSLMWEIMNVGREDNPYAAEAALHNIGLPKFEPRKLRTLGWRPRVGMRQCIAEVLGRLEFYSSESIRLPAHLVEA
jgi:nucleoside-diphosphate-sugar epimerase